MTNASEEASLQLRRQFEEACSAIDANKQGAVVLPLVQFRLLWHRLQPGLFTDEMIDSMVQASCGTSSIQNHGVVDCREFLDWVLQGAPASDKTCELKEATEAQPSINVTAAQGDSRPEVAKLPPPGAPVLSRATSDTTNYAHVTTPEAPQSLARAVTGRVGRSTSRRQLLAPGRAISARSGDLRRAQQVFIQRISTGDMPMTDLMMSRLTRATSTGITGHGLTVEDEPAPQDPISPVAEEAPGLDARFGCERPSTIEGASALGCCGICFDEGIKVASPCGLPACEGRFCQECTGRHAATMVESALYAMPWLKCPGCQGRVPTRAWSDLVESKISERYLNNGEALLNFRCPECHEVGSLFEKTVDADDRERAEKELLDRLGGEEAVAKLHSLWRRFGCAEQSAEDFVAAVIAFLKSIKQEGEGTEEDSDPDKAPEIVSWAMSTQRLPRMVEDPERRSCFQLATLRRFPKILTPCCEVPLCFKCKVSGWHDGVTCEARQREELDIDVQFCSKCGVPTVKSEGCDHIVCVCGASWTWQENRLTNLVEATRIDALEEMLNGGFDINTRDEETGETLLYSAVNARNHTVVTWLLERHADVNAMASDGEATMLEVALYDPSARTTLPVVEALLAARANPNQRTVNYASALHEAVQNYDTYSWEGEENQAQTREIERAVPLVNLLVNNGADLAVRQDMTLESGEETRGGDEEVENGTSSTANNDVPVEADISEQRPANAAAGPSSGPSDAIAAASAGSSKYTGPTPLLLAMSRGLNHVALALVKACAEKPDVLNMKDDSSNTALHVSVGQGNVELVKALVDAGACVNVKGVDGSSVLSTAENCANKETLVNLLLEARANVDVQG